MRARAQLFSHWCDLGECSSCRFKSRHSASFRLFCSRRTRKSITAECDGRIKFCCSLFRRPAIYMANRCQLSDPDRVISRYRVLGTDRRFHVEWLQVMYTRTRNRVLSVWLSVSVVHVPRPWGTRNGCAFAIIALELRRACSFTIQERLNSFLSSLHGIMTLVTDSPLTREFRWQAARITPLRLRCMTHMYLMTFPSLPSPHYVIRHV